MHMHLLNQSFPVFTDHCDIEILWYCTGSGGSYQAQITTNRLPWSAVHSSGSGTVVDRFHNNERYGSFFDCQHVTPASELKKLLGRVVKRL